MHHESCLVADPHLQPQVVVESLVAMQPWRYQEDFPDWFEANPQVWVRFYAEANKVYSRGRRHYSARTILEYLRHETALASDDGGWKLNNNRAPDLARVYLMLHPERGDFFELREGEGRKAPRDLYGRDA